MSTTLQALITYEDGSTATKTVTAEANLTSGYTEINLSAVGPLPDSVVDGTYRWGEEMKDTFMNCTGLQDVNDTRFFGPGDKSFELPKDFFWNIYNNACSYTNTKAGTSTVYTPYNYEIVSGSTEPFCPPNAERLQGCFQNMRSLTGEPAIGENVTVSSYMYSNCSWYKWLPVPGLSQNYYISEFGGLSGEPVFSPKAQTVDTMYSLCLNISKKDAVVPSPVKYMNYLFYGTGSYTGNRVTREVLYIQPTRVNISGNVAFPLTVTQYASAYAFTNVIGTAISTSATSMNGIYNATYISTPAVSDSVKYATSAYAACIELTSFAMGSAVENMYSMYCYCNKSEDSPKISPVATVCNRSYLGCYNMTGPVAMSPKCTNMDFLYYDCLSMTGDASCATTVVYMNNAYGGCRSINSNGVVGPAVKYCSSAYYDSNVNNISILSKVIVNAKTLISKSDIETRDWHIWLPDWETYDPENPTTSATNDLIYAQKSNYITGRDLSPTGVDHTWIDCPEKNCYYFNYGPHLSIPGEHGNVVVHYGPPPATITKVIFDAHASFGHEFSNAPVLEII